MGYRVNEDGTVYDDTTGVRIGVNDKGRYGYILDEDVYRDDRRYEGNAAMSEPVSEALARLATATQKLGQRLGELRNEFDSTVQARRLHEAGQHLGSLSAECLARAAEDDGRCQTGVERVLIDARDEPR